MTASMITESLKRKLSFAELLFQPARKVRVVCDKTPSKSHSQSPTRPSPNRSLPLTQYHRQVDPKTTQIISYPQSTNGIATITVGNRPNVKDSKGKSVEFGSHSGQAKVRKTGCNRETVSATDCFPKPSSTSNKRTLACQETEIELKCHLNKRQRVDGIMAPAATQWNMSISHHIQSSEFNAFNFWKPCLPDVELELVEFLAEKMELSDDNNRKELAGSDEENPEFNSFNFWRDPLPDIEFLDS